MGLGQIMDPYLHGDVVHECAPCEAWTYVSNKEMADNFSVYGAGGSIWLYDIDPNFPDYEFTPEGALYMCPLPASLSPEYFWGVDEQYYARVTVDGQKLWLTHDCMCPNDDQPCNPRGVKSAPPAEPEAGFVPPPKTGGLAKAVGVGVGLLAVGLFFAAVLGGRKKR